MSDVVLDACCVINLFSTGMVREILRPLPHRWHVCEAVEREAPHVYVEDAGTRRKDRIILEPFFTDGTFLRCAITGQQESERYVAFATSLDDGEAMGLAIANSRAWVFATDEGKGRNQAKGAGVSLLSTPEIVRSWAEVSGAANASIVEVIQRISILGKFRPSPNLPYSGWWYGVK